MRSSTSFIGVDLAHFDIFYAQVDNDGIKTNFYFCAINIQINGYINGVKSLFAWMNENANFSDIVPYRDQTMFHISENNTSKKQRISSPMKQKRCMPQNVSSAIVAIGALRISIKWIILPLCKEP